MIMLRTLHKDISRYNQIDSGEDAQEEFGWKLVHGDVFRPPRKGMLLSVFLGSGTQVFCMSLVTLGKQISPSKNIPRMQIFNHIFHFQHLLVLDFYHQQIEEH